MFLLTNTVNSKSCFYYLSGMAVIPLFFLGCLLIIIACFFVASFTSRKLKAAGKKSPLLVGIITLIAGIILFAILFFVLSSIRFER